MRIYIASLADYNAGMLHDVPEFARLYFDYEAFCRDLFMTDYSFHDGHVFRIC